MPINRRARRDGLLWGAGLTFLCYGLELVRLGWLASAIVGVLAVLAAITVTWNSIAWVLNQLLDSDGVDVHSHVFVVIRCIGFAITFGPFIWGILSLGPLRGLEFGAALWWVLFCFYASFRVILTKQSRSYGSFLFWSIFIGSTGSIAARIVFSCLFHPTSM